MSGAPRRHIYLCADDYGISPGVNRAIRDLIGRRRINATSVMVAAPNLQRAEAAALREAAAHGAAIGLHLTLTAPFVPLSHGFAPLRHGSFLSLAATFRRAHLRSLKPPLLMLEIAQQFTAFNAAFGRAPDFIDGHQHVHLFPQIREALLHVARDAAPNAWVRQCGRPLSAHKRFGDRKALLLDALSRRFRRLARDLGVPTNPAFAGTYAFGTRTDYRELFVKFLEGMPDGGVVMCHPGMVDAELQRLDSLTGPREREYAFFKEEAFPGLLEEHGVAVAPVARIER
jgi:chitin disaccharide deacetylase